LNEGEEAVSRLVISVTLVVLLLGLILFGLSDNAISIADTSVPNNEVASSISKASNSSASATITITMYTVADGTVLIPEALEPCLRAT
jgi:hypothetical protein